MKRLLAAIATSILWAVPASPQDAVFQGYAEMRETLDSMMKTRRIADVMRAFGASDEMTEEELAGLQARVRAIYPNDFKHVDLLKSDDMGNGWKREIYAYWTGLSYLYATVLFHRRENELVAIKFKFNSDLSPLISEF